MMVSKVMDNLYIGELSDITRRELLQKAEIVFLIDVRSVFVKEQQPLPSIWTLAWGILDLMERGKVMVHCHGGIDRSPFVATMVVKLYHGTTWDDAWDIVKMGRPQAFRHDDWERKVDGF